MSNAELTSQRTMGFAASLVAGADVINVRLCQFGVIPSALVLALRDRLKVSGVDAAVVPAKVVELQPFRDGADQSLVDHTMRQGIPVLFSDRAPVPELIQSELPVPAPRRFVHDVIDGRKAAVVAGQEFDVLAFHRTAASVGSGSAGHGLSAATHAEAAGVGGIKRLSSPAVTTPRYVRLAYRLAAINTRFGRVGTHSRDLPVGRSVSRPRQFALRGGFPLPEFYQVARP